ncbi:hypothetical protein KAR91_85855 [Candidatus Pacearchaeota archaeon]|nr:hypothetical protein [Candidatus Pacearchaeota archaeon]
MAATEEQVDAALKHTAKFIRQACTPMIGRPHTDPATKQRIMKDLSKVNIGEIITLMDNKEQMTLEEYLRKYNTEEEGWIIDHTLRVGSAPGGDIKFYIHPTNKGGDTLDFEVFGNALFELQSAEPEYLKMEVANTALRGQMANSVILDEHTKWTEGWSNTEPIKEDVG